MSEMIARAVAAGLKRGGSLEDQYAAGLTAALAPEDEATVEQMARARFLRVWRDATPDAWEKHKADAAQFAPGTFGNCYTLEMDEARATLRSLSAIAQGET